MEEEEIKKSWWELLDIAEKTNKQYEGKKICRLDFDLASGYHHIKCNPEVPTYIRIHLLFDLRDYLITQIDSKKQTYRLFEGKKSREKQRTEVILQINYLSELLDSVYRSIAELKLESRIGKE